MFLKLCHVDTCVCTPSWPHSLPAVALTCRDFFLRLLRPLLVVLILRSRSASSSAEPAPPCWPGPPCCWAADACSSAREGASICPIPLRLRIGPPSPAAAWGLTMELVFLLLLPSTPSGRTWELLRRCLGNAAWWCCCISSCRRAGMEVTVSSWECLGSRIGPRLGWGSRIGPRLGWESCRGPLLARLDFRIDMIRTYTSPTG